MQQGKRKSAPAKGETKSKLIVNETTELSTTEREKLPDSAIGVKASYKKWNYYALLARLRLYFRDEASGADTVESLSDKFKARPEYVEKAIEKLKKESVIH